MLDFVLMEVLFDMLKGFLVGICASAPLGPVAILMIQKSLSKGHLAGFLSGLGATVSDTCYAFIAIFALAFAQRFIDAHQSLILLVGGIILVLVGASMALSKPYKKKRRRDAISASPKDFGQAVAMAFTNPGAIFVMFALFAFFGLAKDEPHTWKIVPLILSVSLGSMTYWFFTSWLISKFQNVFKMRTIIWISRIMGGLVVMLGIALFGQGLFNVVFYGKPII